MIVLLCDPVTVTIGLLSFAIHFLLLVMAESCIKMDSSCTSTFQPFLRLASIPSLSFFKTFFLFPGGCSHKPLLRHLRFKTPFVKQPADVHFMVPDRVLFWIMFVTCLKSHPVLLSDSSCFILSISSFGMAGGFPLLGLSLRPSILRPCIFCAICRPTILPCVVPLPPIQYAVCQMISNYKQYPFLYTSITFIPVYPV